MLTTYHYVTTDGRRFTIRSSSDTNVMRRINRTCRAMQWELERVWYFEPFGHDAVTEKTIYQK